MIVSLNYFKKPTKYSAYFPSLRGIVEQSGPHPVTVCQDNRPHISSFSSIFNSSSLHDIPYLFLPYPLLWLIRVRSICLLLWSTLDAPAVLVGFRPVAGCGSVRLRGQHSPRIARNGETRCDVHRYYASRSTTRVRAGLHNARKVSRRAARLREGVEWSVHFRSVSSFHRTPVLLVLFSVP
jgi:hypothetical protein